MEQIGYALIQRHTFFEWLRAIAAVVMVVSWPYFIYVFFKHAAPKNINWKDDEKK